MNMIMKPFAFDYAAMRARKDEYYRYARCHAALVFKPDGTYQPATEDDSRLPYWLYPALVSSSDPTEREFANVVYAAAPAWDEWNVFTTSSIAANLVRERKHMRTDLVKRSEEHLAKFVVRDGGRLPCSGANDYMFQGYNDNMPAMSVRAMILAGEALDRKDYTDQGLFYLEGLCAHFERRGLLSEYTSGTYLPITLAALMDVTECSANRAAREMALACSHRILLDVFGHWHQHVGGLGGAQSRAYTSDCIEGHSCLNALMWYLTGSPFCVNVIEALTSKEQTGTRSKHQKSNFSFDLAQYGEFFTASYEDIGDGVRAFARAPRAYPYEIYATADSGQAGLFGGVKEIQTRAFHQPLYGLGTASATWFDQSGQSLPLHAVLSASPDPSHAAGWRDRIPVWQKTIEGALDQGDKIKLPQYPDQAPVESNGVPDVGHYHVLQKGGSALVLGALGPALVGKEVSQLKFSLLFGTTLRMPEETVEEGKWHFLRFGDVYVGARMSAIVEEQRMTPRRVVKNNYLRVEVPLIDGRAVPVTHEFRQWCDFGYVFEIAAQEECGSFAEFRRQCLACTWDYYHCFYRTSRYCGRHGELQIIDSVAAGSVRFMAIDGVVEPQVKLAATGLDPQLTQLFPDGHRVKQRRLTYRPDFIGSPFYPIRQHILETDLPGEK